MTEQKNTNASMCQTIWIIRRAGNHTALTANSEFWLRSWKLRWNWRVSSVITTRYAMRNDQMITIQLFQWAILLYFALINCTWWWNARAIFLRDDDKGWRMEISSKNRMGELANQVGLSQPSSFFFFYTQIQCNRSEWAHNLDHNERD